VRASARLQGILAALGGARRIVDSFFAATMGIAGVLAAAYTVQATLRLRVEETELRAEPVLATAVGRTRWALGHLAHAALGPAVLLATLGLTAGLTTACARAMSPPRSRG
jgi:ABC-2 type transport system permease protein